MLRFDALWSDAGTGKNFKFSHQMLVGTARLPQTRKTDRRATPEQSLPPAPGDVPADNRFEFGRAGAVAKLDGLTLQF